MVRDYIRRTNTAFQGVDADWKRAENAGRADAAELKQWRGFLQDWQTFRKDVDDTWADMANVLAPFDARTATVQRIDEYRKQLGGWARKVKKALGPLGASSPTLERSSAGARGWWAKFGTELAIGLAVAGATAVVVTIFGGKR